eukprot:TRINITY_DN6848_c1_g2_i1.p1 TRINITY_DN6848_c1_g2~~TRINITY_DN6848_c1_g2_i1.p1  ORF type:complete len:108 (-),score=6.47 TRINITY_DN6848_c1_g2_i1:150-473(-)
MLAGIYSWCFTLFENENSCSKSLRSRLNRTVQHRQLAALCVPIMARVLLKIDVNCYEQAQSHFEFVRSHQSKCLWSDYFTIKVSNRVVQDEMTLNLQSAKPIMCTAS